MSLVLNWLKAVNFRNHRNLKIDFREGVTGIVGGNGSGKSTIIEIIQFVFQGTFDGDSKEKVITLGEASGYAGAGFTYEGKEGTIERHLDASKVILHYDGKVYKKATEVKELWDKLMQITPDIMNNVVIARQGEIPKLFCGDSSVREKLFQKIFLVPNTEKIRKTIWEEYIKKAPQAYFVANQDDLQKAYHEAEEVEGLKKETLDTFRVVAQEEFSTIYQQQSQWKKQLQDHATLTQLDQELTRIRSQVEPVEQDIAATQARLGTIDVNVYRQQVIDLNRAQAVNANRLKIESEINQLKLQLLPEPERSNLADTINAMILVLQEDNRINNLEAHEYRVLSDRLGTHRALKGHAKCPTCKQGIEDIAKFIEDTEKELQALRERSRSAKIAATESEIAKLNVKLSTHNNVATRISTLVSSFNGLTEQQFDPQTLEVAIQVVQTYEAMERDVKNKKMSIASLQTRISTITGQMQGLAYVADPQALQTQLDYTQVQLAQLNEITQNRKNAEVAYNEAVALVKVAQDRIESNQAAQAKNQKRDQYVQDLGEVYEALHTAEFPRKLIQSYAGIVTEYLNKHLSSFIIDYTAQVNDNFGIDVLDSAGRILPKVSGGQEVIIGLSLRLALHDLFGQGFPMMIIDEASAALHENNKQAYFDVVRQLKQNSKLKQIIIIDHDERLRDVVDNTIAL
jgi:DNA repair exonuclease SbcCD ATPase subunit